MADFSCIPCAGLCCFARDVTARKTCSQERHTCPYREARHGNTEWKCRCCPDCAARCAEQNEFLEKVYGTNV